MRTRTHVFALAALLALLGGVTACSNDSGGGDQAVDAGQDGGGDTGGDGGEGNGGDCAGTDVTYEGPGTEDFEASSTLAVSLADGAAYTVYLGDFDISPEDVGIVSTPEPGEGETLITVAITIFNAEGTPPPLEVGEEITYIDDFGVLTFRVTSQTGETMNGNNSDASGMVTLTSVGDTFCAEVEYEDGEKSISGTIEAPVTAM